jgi:putative FmdB family regulatory protein
MGIVRTYMCPDCGHGLEVTLRSDQWNAPPPECPECQAHEMGQEFKPIAIGGSTRARAVQLAETIAAEDYGVADFKAQGRQGEAAKVRYKDSTAPPSTWLGLNGTAQFEQAKAFGRETRRRYGDGLDVLQHNLKTGAQPDLIEVSKRRSMKVW